MEKVINHLRNKSEEDRRHLLHFATIFFAIIMLVIWSYTLGSSLTSEETKEQFKQDVEPFQSLTENLSSSYESVSSNPTSDLQE